MSANELANGGSLRINPYTVPDHQHGWRGLSVPGNFKRKWYTVLHNEQVLVTALLLLPGEQSIRHSHESGELSIRFTGELRPIVTWNAPGLLHGPPAPPPDLVEPLTDVLAEEALRGAAGGDPQLAALARQVVHLQQQLQAVQTRLQEHLQPEPVPTLIVDVLFPPFKTTIDDPHYPERRTVVGQWYD